MSLRESHSKIHRSRTSWTDRPPKIGDLVLIGEKGTSRIQWKKARIMALQEGKDKAIRSAELSLPTGKKCIRAITQLYPLETSFLDLNATNAKAKKRSFLIVSSLFHNEQSCLSLAPNPMSVNGNSEVWGERTPTGVETLSPSRQLEKLNIHDDSMEVTKEPATVATTAGTEGKKKKKQTGKSTGNTVVTMSALREQWLELQRDFQQNLMGMVDQKLQEVLAANTPKAPAPSTLPAPVQRSSGIPPPAPIHRSSGIPPPSIPRIDTASSSGSQDNRGRIPIWKNWQTKKQSFCHRCKTKGHITRNCRSRQNGENQRKGGAKNIYNISLKG